LDAEGRTSGAPTTVVPTPIVSGDVEVVRGSGRTLFAWTDRTSAEAAVVAASLDDRGGAAQIRRVVESRGGAALLGFASGTTGAALMFEAPAHRKSERRKVHVARIGS